MDVAAKTQLKCATVYKLVTCYPQSSTFIRISHTPLEVGSEIPAQQAAQICFKVSS